MKRFLLLILSLMMLLPAISGCKGHSATPGSKSTDDRTAAEWAAESAAADNVAVTATAPESHSCTTAIRCTATDATATAATCIRWTI